MYARGKFPRPPITERLMAKVSMEPMSGCWLWTGATNPNGYGHMSVNGHFVDVHRVSYEQFIGEIPDGLTLDHKCRVRCCANPEHLEAVPQLDNWQRGLGLSVAHDMRRSKTHCINGHEFTEENTYRQRDGSRACKECNRAWHRQKRNRQ